MGMYTLHKGFWEDKHIFSGFHIIRPQQFMSWFGHMGCLASHQTTWVDLPCCYWLNLKPQDDFTSLAIHTKLYILGGWEHCVKVWWVTRSKSKVSRPLFSLVLEAGDIFCFVVKHRGVKSENLMKRGLWSRLKAAARVCFFRCGFDSDFLLAYFFFIFFFFNLLDRYNKTLWTMRLLQLCVLVYLKTKFHISYWTKLWLTQIWNVCCSGKKKNDKKKKKKKTH